jgi:hypothetical protein
MEGRNAVRIRPGENANMRARLIAIFLLAAAGLLSHTTANADITRCGDANGKTLYTDSACPAGMHAVGVTALPQTCTSKDCEQRREREIDEANERARIEKEHLAAYTAERQKRELEDRWLDEARYEAELRSTEAAQAPAEETVYPVIVGAPARCGAHCASFPHRRHSSGHRVGTSGQEHHGVKDPGQHRQVRAGNVPSRRPATGRSAPRGRIAIDG